LLSFIGDTADNILDGVAGADTFSHGDNLSSHIIGDDVVNDIDFIGDADRFQLINRPDYPGKVNAAFSYDAGNTIVDVSYEGTSNRPNPRSASALPILRDH